jgi:hypothetical protein
VESGKARVLFLEGEIFLPKETDYDCDDGDDHFGWSRVDTANFHKQL